MRNFFRMEDYIKLRYTETYVNLGISAILRSISLISPCVRLISSASGEPMNRGRWRRTRDPVATQIVAQMDELFAVDAEARRKALGIAERHVRRQERAKPLLDGIRGRIEAAQSMALPSSALSKACHYALGLWKKLTRFLEYPELELSTNLAENSMRPVALGRKNWLHLGSPQAGPKVASILSVVESCRRLRISVRDYLAAVLPGLADRLIQRLSDLTPAAWVARHS
jgi:transposase